MSVRSIVYAAILLCLVACVPVRDATSNAKTPATRTLQTTGYGQAHTSAPTEIKQFGRLTGRWECSLSERRSDGSWRPRPSKVNWVWFYTLDGLAIQDIWTSQDKSADLDVIATNLRLYDVAKQQWNVAWTNTRQSAFELWTGSEVDGEMILHSIRDRRPVKIRFFSILPRQFQWTYEAATSLEASEFIPVIQMLCQRLD